MCARPVRASSGPSSSTEPRSRPTSARSGASVVDASACGCAASSCRCLPPRRRYRAAAAPSPRRRRCAARWSGRTRPRSAGTPPAAAAPRSCCLPPPRGPRAGARLRSVVSTSAAALSAETPRPRCAIQNPTNTGSGRSQTPNHPATARLTARANRSTSRGRRAAAVDERQRMLRRNPTAPSAWPLRNPDRSISHAAGIFTRPSAMAKPGTAFAGDGRDPLAIVGSGHDGIHEERADAARVRIVVIEHHALATADRQHRVANVDTVGLDDVRALQVRRRRRDRSTWAVPAARETSRRTR